MGTPPAPAPAPDPDAAHAVALLRAGIEAVQSVDLSAVPAAELMALAADVEIEGRRLDSVKDALAGEIDRSGAYGIDGHRSAKAALMHIGRLPGPEADRRVRVARALVRLPQLAGAYRAGEVPTEHVRVAANVVRNPRIDDFINDTTDAFFTEEARKRSHQAYSRLLSQWERLADQDGTLDDSDHTHENRKASLTIEYDGGFRLEVRGGALHGSIIEGSLAYFEDLEFQADWEAAHAIHGDQTRVEHLERTATQRRHDALVAMARAARAADPATTVEPDPLVNVYVDQETFERAMATAGGQDIGPDDPTRVDHVRAQTSTGTPLTLMDIAECAIVGHVRRVVINSNNVVIDLGRRERLFKRGARDAVLLGRWPGQDPGCVNCGIPDRWSQADHNIDWQHGGPTSPWNGTIRCGYHNRLKNAGFTMRRHTDGTETLIRPDGTPTTAAV